MMYRLFLMVLLLVCGGEMVKGEVKVLNDLTDNIFPDTLKIGVGEKEQIITVQPVSTWTDYNEYFAVLTDMIDADGTARNLVRMSDYGKKHIAIGFHRQYPDGMNDLQLTALWRIVENHNTQQSARVIRCTHKLSRRGHYHHKGMKQQGYDCTLEDKAFFTYRFSNYHDSLDVGLQREAIKGAMQEFTAVTGQSFVEVVATEKVDLIFSFSGIDGKGNTLAETQVPMCGSGHTYAIVFDDKDDWVLSGASNDKSLNDVYSVTVHEVGHFLGLQHEDDESSVMYYMYTGGERRDLSFADIERLQQPYIIEKKTARRVFYTKAGSNQQITRNFKSKEFASKCKDAVYTQKVDTRLAQAVQIIRNYYNVPVYINSTHRTEQCNIFAGGALSSQHLFQPTAVADFSFKNATYLEDFNHQIRTEGALFQMLLVVGVRGFGLYDGHGHLDFREETEQGNGDYRGTKYVFWDYSGKNKLRKTAKGHNC